MDSLNFSNKENVQSNNIKKAVVHPINKLKALNANSLQRKEESATTELDQVFNIYSTTLIPKSDSLVANQLKIDAIMEKRIILEEAKIKQLQVLSEKVKCRILQEEMRHELEKNQILNEYAGFRMATDDRALKIAELEAKLEILKQNNTDLIKIHIIATNENQVAKKENEDQSASLQKESALNQNLSEKTAAERAILDFNHQRVERYASRAEFYYHYDKFLHNKKQELKGNIRVFCRIRPIVESDLGQIAMCPAQNRLSVKPFDLPKLNFNAGNPAGIKSKKRLEELKIPFSEKMSSSQQAFIKSPRKQTALPQVEDTFKVKDEHSLTLSIYPELFGEKNQFRFNTYQQALLQGTQPSQSQKIDCHKFKFDKVFSHRSSQEDVFDEVRDVVRSALDGFRVCIFAYGQTNAGKTFTMEGGLTPQTMGLVPRSVNMIFETLQKYKEQDWRNVKLMMSCFEIHIETVRDLLDPTNEIAQIMTNQNKFKLHEIEVTQISDVEFVLNRAKENRKTAKTAMNEKSSRSHSIFQLKITGLKSDGKTELNGALNLIDLAGSEKMSSSSGDLERQKEATAINKSLSSLGDVISAIIRGDSYIPFRNSKLTHMLQNFMGGDAKTLMIVNVSPLQANAYETKNSLLFASKVNSVKMSQVGGSAMMPNSVNSSLSNGNQIGQQQ